MPEMYKNNIGGRAPPGPAREFKRSPDLAAVRASYF